MAQHQKQHILSETKKCVRNFTKILSYFSRSIVLRSSCGVFLDKNAHSHIHTIYEMRKVGALKEMTRRLRYAFFSQTHLKNATTTTTSNNELKKIYQIVGSVEARIHHYYTRFQIRNKKKKKLEDRTDSSCSTSREN